MFVLQVRYTKKIENNILYDNIIINTKFIKKF